MPRQTIALHTKALLVHTALGLALLSLTSLAHAASPRDAGPQVSKVWVADQGDGTYKNPILHADYSDPDVIRVGDDFYMTASSFQCAPGLPILHSKDLVNWTLIGHGVAQQPPLEVFSTPQPGNGAWAPALRYHDGEFCIYYPDPDYGIYRVKARNPAGPWSEPLLVKKVKGWIDPCPFWDDDGKAYLVNALAASRSGIKSILVLSRMSADGTRLLDAGTLIFDGHDTHPTLEGPKLYKRKGYYYVFAPAGGVTAGWQLVLRSRSIYGPYEEKVVLSQGSTPINGPHQGAWVDTASGESWFIHFQDKDVYGRVVHLQPMRWADGWPMIGVHQDQKGTGEPVLTYKKPNVAKTWPIATPAESDEFSGNSLGLQWQWHANPQDNWAFPAGPLGFLRLFNVLVPEDSRNLCDVPNLLLQKFPAPSFTATAKVTFTPRSDGEKIGLVVMGLDYGTLAVTNTAEGLRVSQAVCKDADRHGQETESTAISVKPNTFFLQVKVSEGGICRFAISTDGAAFTTLSEPFTARKGKWIGAKVGLFATRTAKVNESGYADIDWFRIE